MKRSKLARTLAVFLLLGVLGGAMLCDGAAGCGSNAVLGTVNPHFPDAGDGPTATTASIDPENTDQVTVIEPGPSDQAGKIGTIADQDPSHVLCVVIDPSAGRTPTWRSAIRTA
jgi:hypothetical protein